MALTVRKETAEYKMNGELCYNDKKCQGNGEEMKEGNMNKKKLESVIQNISTAAAIVVFLGFGVPQAVAYGTEIAAVEVKAAEQTNDKETAITDFSVRLLQHTMEKESNTLVSPYSILSALTMTANGADGDTLSQMEDVFGLSLEELNTYLYSYQEYLDGDTENKLSVANSIWLSDDESIQVNEEFLQNNAQWYGSDIYRTPMDEGTLEAINSWVNHKTEGMIPQILDEIPGNAMMYLVNALAFDAEWATVYTEADVREGTFTKADGSERSTELMYSEEYNYLKDENAEGFLKYYRNGKYAFAALLPDEEITIDDYVNGLTGERLHSILSGMESCTVNAAIPKFKTEYAGEMSEILKEMGMPDAFSDKNADFTRMCSCDPGEVHIGRVLHKTFLEVNERGTKAGAATVVEMLLESAAEEPEEPKTVYLDRPFVYMLVDTQANLPIFLGTAMDIGE